MSVPMDAVQLDLAGSDRSVVFVRVRTNPTSQVFACFRVQWTRALRGTGMSKKSIFKKQLYESVVKKSC
jgi:hypothetical protein